MNAATPAPSLWRDRDFNIYWLGQTLSGLGDAFAAIALPLLVLQSTGSLHRMGRLTALVAVAHVVAGLASGALVDRVDRRRLMIACDLGRWLVYSAVPIVWWLHGPSYWLLVAAGALPLSALVLSARDLSPAQKARTLSGYALLVLALAALCLLPYDREGMLRWMLRYNLAIRLTGNELTGSGATLVGTYLLAHWPIVTLALASGAWLSRDPRSRVGVMVAALWFAATVVTFTLWKPLWDNYFLWTLIAPALLAGAGVARFLSRRVLDPTASPRSRLLSGLAVAALALSLAPRSIPWRGRSATMEAVVRDLQSVTAPGEYVVSDDPFMVFVGGRRAPPPLADTSNKSIVTGFLSSADALSAMRRYRVRVVVLGTGRLARMDAFLRAVRSASIDRRVIGDHERMVIDPARLR